MELGVDVARVRRSSPDGRSEGRNLVIVPPYYEDNPAQRLYLALEEMVRYPDATHTAARAWAAILGVDDYRNNISTLLTECAKVLDDAREAKRRIEALEDNDLHLLLSPFPQIDAMMLRFAQLESITVPEFLRGYEATTRTVLSFCAARLAARWPDRTIEESSLGQLIEQTDALLATLTTADDLDAELRLWLTDRVSQIQRALRNYRIGGMEAVQRAFDETIGGLGNRGFLSRLGTSKSAQGLHLLLSTLLLALNTAHGVKEITSGPAQPAAIILQIGGGGSGVITTPGAKPHAVNTQAVEHDIVDAEVIEPEEPAR